MSVFAVEDRVITVRERVFVTHLSAYQREITREFTLLNGTKEHIPTIMLYATKFMPALKVFDESGNELPYFTNDYTKRVFRAIIKVTDKNGDKEGNRRARLMLNNIEKRNLFLIWIRLLPKSFPENQLKIIKLRYHDNSSPRVSNSNRLIEQKYLFSIPNFTDDYLKPEGSQHDLFYVVDVPEGNTIFLEEEPTPKTFIRKIDKSPISINEKIEEKILTKANGVYIDKYRHSLSIRLPPVNDKIEFNLKYSVLPEKNERIFFAVAVFSLIITSIFFLAIATIHLPQEIKHPIQFLYPNLDIYGAAIYYSLVMVKPIEAHLNTLFGGLVTACLAAIGLIRTPMMTRTRFWFIIPIVVSAVGFLINNSS